MVKLFKILLCIFLGGIQFYSLVTTMQETKLLQQNGSISSGKLQLATRKAVNAIPTRYSLKVEFNGIVKDFPVSKELYSQYVQDDKFKVNDPVDITYLTGKPETANVTKMLGVWFYWFGGPGTNILAGALFFFLALISLKGGKSKS